MSAESTPILLAAAQRGDRPALEALLKCHRQAVYRYGLRYCKTSEDAEDAVQETLWAAARSIRSFRHASSVMTWLFTIVRNKCHRTRRGRKSDDLADWLPLIDDKAESSERIAAMGEAETLLANALSKLDPSDREVILLRDVEGLTAPEAASKLSITVAALKSRLHRARGELRESLRELRPFH